MYGLFSKLTADIEAQQAPKNRQPSHDKGCDLMVLEIRCGVEGCENLAACEVILYDIYFDSGEVFFERDITCPYVCQKHMIGNERQAYSYEETRCPPRRQPRGTVHYPFTNKNHAQGFTIYRPIEMGNKAITPDVM
jgi:hypothetical protein